MSDALRGSRELGGVLLVGVLALCACGGRVSRSDDDDRPGGVGPGGVGSVGDGDGDGDDTDSDTTGLEGGGGSATIEVGSGGDASGGGDQGGGSGGGSGGTEGECDVQDDPRVEACGLNDRGQRKQTCEGTVWGEWSACQDPDECEDGQARTVPCGTTEPPPIQPQRCWDGSWQDSDVCVSPCPNGQEYDAIAGACVTPIACDATKSDIGGGSGTQADPYVICSVQQLEAVSHALSAHYFLAQSLYLGNVQNFEPLGSTSAPFRGVFDGQGRALEGLKWAGLAPGGLFGVLDAATVRLLLLRDFQMSGGAVLGALAGWAQNGSFIFGVEAVGGKVAGSSEVGGLVGRLSQSSLTASGGSPDVEGTYDIIGGLVGRAHDASTVDGWWVGGKVSGSAAVGGLVGNLHDQSFVHGYVDGDVVGTGNAVGGLVGNNIGSMIHRGSSVAGSVTGLNAVGGLVGGNVDAALEGSWSLASVFGAGEAVGGLVGYNQNSPLTSCYHSHMTTGGADSVGGLVGFNVDSAISHCRASGATSGDEQVGGLVGRNERSAVSESFVQGDVTATGDAVGGLVGYNLGSTLRNSHVLGDVSGNNEVGGLLGNSSDSTVQQSYALGSVLGNGATGGVVGSNTNSPVLACFALEQGILAVVGENVGNASLLDTRQLTLAGFAEPATFVDAGWDFNGVWLMSNDLGYPILQWMQ